MGGRAGQRFEARTGKAVDVPHYLRDLVAGEKCNPSRARGLVYRALVRAAQRGYPCPTGWELATIVGYDTAHGTVELMKRLERLGLIEVSRHQRSRQVKICETDWKTRPCTNETPHWRSIHAQAEGV